MMRRNKYLIGRFERPHRWRRRAALAALLLVLGIVGAYLFLTSSTRLARLAGGLLADMTGAEVHIGQAEFGLDGVVQLRNVRLLSPQMPGDEKRVFHADEVLIKHDLLSLLRGKFVARSLTLSQPTLFITEDSATGKFNYEYLRRSNVMPTTLPEVYIRQGTIVRGELENGVYKPVFRFNVDGKLTAQDKTQDQYFFALRQYDVTNASEPNADPDSEPSAEPSTASTPRLSGSLNLRTMNVEVKLDRFAVETRQGDVLPSRLRRWWQMMQPEGELSSIRISYDPEARGFRAVLEVEHTALTLPYLNKAALQLVESSPAPDAPDATQEPEPQHQFRLTDVSGRFEIVNDRINIRNLQGLVEGIHYTIEGQIDGLDREAPFHLSLRTHQFEIPQDPRFLPALPPAVRAGFDNLKPSGLFQLDLELDRRRGDALTYRGTVNMAQARFTYAKFPYPLQDVSGRLVFDDETIKIDRILARGPSGAQITLDGQIAPPDDAAAVHITIAARNVPFDEHILTALHPRYHPIINMFADEAALQRLLKLNIIDGPAPGDTHFQIGGTTDYDIVITRTYGPGQRVKTQVTMQMAGLNVMFTHWPYPLKLTGGTLFIGDEHVDVRNITAVGLHGGGGVASGTIEIPRDEATDKRAFIPKLQIEARGLPMDELLLAAIPHPQNQWLRDLSLAGRIDADAQVFNNEQGKIDYRIDAQLSEGAAQPFGGAFVIEALQGAARIGNRSVVFDSIQGRHGDSIVQLSGKVHSEDENWQFHIDFLGKNLRFEDPLLDLIPRRHGAAQTLSQLFNTYKPAGAFDARLTYETDSVHGEQYALELEPHTLAFDFQNRRVSLSEGRGKVLIEPQRLELAQFGASFGTGAFDVMGNVSFGDPLSVNLQIDAQAEHLDETVRLALPPAVLSAVDGLKMDGNIALRDARLQYRGPTVASAARAAPSSFSFKGDLQISGGQAELGVPIRDLQGDLAITASRRGSERWPLLDLDLHAKHLKAADRLVSALDLRLSSVPQPGVLELTELGGSVYGGLLRGEGRIDLNRRGKYLFQLVLLDAPLDPIIHPLKYAAPDGEATILDVSEDDEQPVIIRATPPGDERQLLQTGRLSASLDIESFMDQPDTRRGRGELQIRRARMYELPLAMALLQMLNLSTPSSGSFDEANARFVIAGDNVLFDLVSITAPTIALTGDGAMRYSDRSLDLLMYSNNPQGPDLGALSDIFNLVKDELVCVRVKGTLDEPQPHMANFRGIRESWRAIFGKKPAMIEPRAE